MPQTQTIGERIECLYNTIEDALVDFHKETKGTGGEAMFYARYKDVASAIQALVDEVREGLISEIRHTTVAYDDRVSDDLVGKRLRMILNNEETNNDTRRIEPKRGSIAPPQ